MKYAILADVHGNATALEAVIADARKQGAEEYVCVGDIVGYGAEPESCIARVTGLCRAAVAGNHDRAATGRNDMESFNPDARDSALWTRERLSSAHRQYLDSLPLSLDIEGASVVHGSLYLPEQFNYILCSMDALGTFERMTQSLCFVGHTHVPLFFTLDGALACEYGENLALKKDVRAIVNAGSVGQPRDEDRRASYALYDSGERTVSVRRVGYDWEAAAEKILAAGLPKMNAYRLALGQ